MNIIITTTKIKIANMIITTLIMPSIKNRTPRIRPSLLRPARTQVLEVNSGNRIQLRASFHLRIQMELHRRIKMKSPCRIWIQKLNLRISTPKALIGISKGSIKFKTFHNLPMDHCFSNSRHFKKATPAKWSNNNESCKILKVIHQKSICQNLAASKGRMDQK